MRVAGFELYQGGKIRNPHSIHTVGILPWSLVSVRAILLTIRKFLAYEKLNPKIMLLDDQGHMSIGHENLFFLLNQLQVTFHASQMVAVR